MGFFYNSLSFEVFGQTTMALRLPWALIGTLTVLITFFLVRQLSNASLGLLTATLLAVFHYHIHYSRLGSNQIADPFFLALALLFLYRGLERGGRADWALAGVTAGTAFYFYAGARLTPVIIAAVVCYIVVLNPGRFWRSHVQGLLSMVAGFFVSAAPMLQYAIRFPADFNSRLNEVGIIQSGWLEREVGIRGDSKASILFDQFEHAAFAFNYFPTERYGMAFENRYSTRCSGRFLSSASRTLFFSY